MSSIFGFPEFLTALALLMLVYGVSDPRYRFRIHAAPLPLPQITFWSILVIGGGSLLIDVWYAEGWPTVPALVGRAGLQAVLALAFLGMTILWVATAYVAPPRFGSRNAKHFYDAVFWRIMKGDERDMAVAAAELAASMKQIVRHCPSVPHRGETPPPPTDVQLHAHRLLLLIGNRRFCKQVVRSSPETAINLFYEMSDSGKRRLPVRPFVQSLMIEALRHEDSMLYDEADEFGSDLVGLAKPFSRALFGDYQLVESLQSLMASPTDLGSSKLDMTAAQYEAYGSASLIFVEAFLKDPDEPAYSYALASVFNTMRWASMGAYRLSDVIERPWEQEPARRIRVAVRFIDRVMKLLESVKRRPVGRARQDHYGIPRDIYDMVGQLMFEIVDEVSAIKGDSDRTWTLHHNMVWGEFFGLESGPEWDAARRRLVRRLHAHLAEMDKFANFLSARLLGYSLNVLGVEDRVRERSRDLACYHRALLNWFAANYLTLRRDYPDVAEACLVGGISFDEGSGRLIKTYAKGTKSDPTRRYLELAPARVEPWDQWS
ncbi:hypothetical protein [Brevundimonas subvibrioides]|uniref:hypothetical protein n=1 Tax=Brevundimonas subvibrioides TaxID=74313 RepID=UPI0022B5713C|nr:hypothetical protein [Brevundimonas subvibrioides]